jgi:gustatory receptor
VKFNFPQRGTRDDFIYDGTFHEAVGSIMAISQAFGIMPVHGIKGKNPKYLRFKKCAFRFFLCIFYMFAFAWATCLTVYWMWKTKLEFGKIINFTFNFTNLISVLCFLELAQKWPQLMAKWYSVEKFLPQIRSQFEKQRMAYQIRMVSLVILFSSLSKFVPIFPHDCTSYFRRTS